MEDLEVSKKSRSLSILSSTIKRNTCIVEPEITEDFLDDGAMITGGGGMDGWVDWTAVIWKLFEYEDEAIESLKISNNFHKQKKYVSHLPSDI